MKAIATILLLSFAFLSVKAQQVWTEGTTWEVHTVQSDGITTRTEVYTYELGEPVSFNDTIYYTLTETHQDVTHIVSYLRAEGDDAYVYARHFNSDEVGVHTGECSEILLYDFSKPFELGDTLRYSTYEGFLESLYIDPRYAHLNYYHDVIEPGDCLPEYNFIIYKIGNIYGPVYYISDYSNPTSIPNSHNVSHVLFKTKGKPHGSMITLRIDIVHDLDGQSYSCYPLSGMRYPGADSQVLFKKGNVLISR